MVSLIHFSAFIPSPCPVWREGRQEGTWGQVSHFRVCRLLGKVVANRTVDYEEVQWLNFTVRASDNGSPRRSAEIPVYLQIVDINDNNPVFSQPSYQVSQDPFSESWGFSGDTTTPSVPEPSKEDGQHANMLHVNVLLWAGSPG